MPRVTDLLGRDGLIERGRGGGCRPRRPDPRAARPSRPPATCASRTSRAATRASCWRSAIRRSAAMPAPIPSPARSGSARSRSTSTPELGLRRSARPDHADRMPDGQPVQGQRRGAAQFTRGYGLVFGHGERKAMAMALVDRAAGARARRGAEGPGAGRGIRALALRQRPGDRLRRAPEAAALCRLPGRARPHPASAAPSTRHAWRANKSDTETREAAE
jgi:hypothetical protein